MQCSSMAVSLTPQNKHTLKRLLKTGRWNNESEVLRYGLYLVEEEVKAKQREDLSPLPDHVLAEALNTMTAEERAEERRLGRASARPKSAKDLE